MATLKLMMPLREGASLPSLTPRLPSVQRPMMSFRRIRTAAVVAGSLRAECSYIHRTAIAWHSSSAGDVGCSSTRCWLFVAFLRALVVAPDHGVVVVVVVVEVVVVSERLDPDHAENAHRIHSKDSARMNDGRKL